MQSKHASELNCTSGDYNYGHLHYPCPRNINGNVMTLIRRTKESNEMFEHQMFSNLWQNSGALADIWGKIPIAPLLINWKRNYFKLKDKVFIFGGPRNFLSTGMWAKKYDIKQNQRMKSSVVVRFIFLSFVSYFIYLIHILI